MEPTTKENTARLEGTLRRQYDIITRSQALSAGLTPNALHHRLRKGASWSDVLPSVYMAATGTPTPHQRLMAAQLYGGSGSVITGTMALARHGIWHPDGSAVDVLIPAERKRRDADFVRILRTTRMPERVWCDGALQFALASRAVADTALHLPSLRDVREVVASAVQRRRCTIGDLTRELRDGPCQGSANLRTALSDVVAGVRSTAEADLKDVLQPSGLPMPLFNAMIVDGDELVAIPDAWYQEFGIAIEVDSIQWHLGPEDHRRSVARARKMGQLAIVVLTFTPNQIRAQPDRVIEEIRKAIASARAARRAPLNLRTIPVNHPDYEKFRRPGTVIDNTRPRRP